ncbi:V-set and immunoglobulin domain-containing protein 10 isoform X3 [Arvicanthis niloticus]|uniref:V-set and immunoglobulin domain-containing protein 10 isoform X3 n=1 Tax=Arvicanthis niloticus TaxID=61156 RepID=UPI00402B33DB
MAGLRVLLCLGALLARQGSADLEAVAVGEVHANVTLRCGNASGSRGLVTWYRNNSEPAFLVSSNSSLPPAAPRFSLEDAGALHIEALRLEDDGNYTCQEVLNETHWFPVRLEVARPPLSAAPQCSVEVSSSESTTLELICNWDGGYPDPTFLWTEEPGGTIMGNSKLQTLSPSQLSKGKKFKCVGSHILGPESGASCVVQISSPLLASQPMKTCFVGGSVTLTCEVTGANPPARIQWLRNLTKPEAAIQPSSRYVITQQGQSSSLTIHNCSQDLDGGFYFCRADNPIGVRVVDFWLSVKEPVNIGGIVGTVVSLLLLGLAIVSGLMLYYSPAFCWKAGNTFRGQDMGDVMVLVDSEEEEEEEEEGEEEEDKEDVAEEMEQETTEVEELPKEISKHGRIHRVTALINGNLDRMGNGLREFQDDSDGQQSDIVQEEDKPV